MKASAIAAAISAVLVAVASTQSGRLSAQPGCLHSSGESSAQRGRRGAAIRLARAINTAEANGSFRRGGEFQPLDALGVDVASADGFDAQFTTNGKTYALLLRDATDPCGFTISTNQVGVIFQGYPIDYDVQPVQR